MDFIEGNGTTLEIQNYVYTDEQPIDGKNYYRLKQLDYDGQFDYSDIVTIELQTMNDDVRIYPNPVQDRLTVSNMEGVENVTIYNTLGQPVKQLAVSS